MRHSTEISLAIAVTLAFFTVGVCTVASLGAALVISLRRALVQRRERRHWLDMSSMDRFTGWSPPNPVTWPSVADLVDGRRPVRSEPEREFMAYYVDRPMVWDLFCKHCEVYLDAGMMVGGQRKIWESVRGELEARGEEPQVNNNCTKRYAQLWMERNPNYIGWFRFRADKAVGVVMTDQPSNVVVLQ